MWLLKDIVPLASYLNQTDVVSEIGKKCPPASLSSR
jgi:hypothetical protein